MIHYPLYEELLQRVNMKEDKTFNAHEICMTLNAIARMQPESQKEHYEEIAALILHHESVDNSGIRLLSIPYEGKQMPNDNILHNFIKFPLLLKYIIVEYIQYYS